MQIRQIEYNSEDYKNELKLRDEVLRKPLGMNLNNDNLTADKIDVHFGAFVKSTLIGVLILTKISPDDVKMRQVAVAEKWRAKTIGSQLVFFAEQYARNKGYKTMQLNARKTAVAFYEKLGYEKISEEFLEINIPHYKMRKSLKY